MKKILAIALAAAIFMAAPVAQAREAGGLAGGLVGCCFGVRTAAAWNEGKNLDTITESIQSVSAKVAGIDVKIAACTKEIAASTLNEVAAALKAAAGDATPASEKTESQAERDRVDAKAAANDIALHISAALDRIDGQIRAALDAAQMKVEG